MSATAEQAERLQEALEADPRTCPACGGSRTRTLRAQGFAMSGDLQCRACGCTWSPGWTRRGG
jgi:hypothetical protein